MARKSAIEWTDATWNPIRGCSRVSEGCRHCYAESVAYRFSGSGQPYEGLVTIGADGKRQHQWNGQIRFIEDRLLDPLRWQEPRKIFVNSMSDLFHENVTDPMLDRIFAVMALSPRHTFQILTKRPERMLAYIRDRGNVNSGAEYIWHQMVIVREKTGAPEQAPNWPLPNVWLGVSVEDQKAADGRIPFLLQAQTAKRFISAEPLLGPVDLTRLNLAAYVTAGLMEWHKSEGREIDPENYPKVMPLNALTGENVGGELAPRLDWVIVGGESGPGARPMHPDWARGLRDQCDVAGVPFFFKQWGDWTPGENVEACKGLVKTAAWFDGRWIFSQESLANTEGHREDEPDLYRVGKKSAGNLLDGKRHHHFPEVAK